MENEINLADAGYEEESIDDVVGISTLAEAQPVQQEVLPVQQSVLPVDTAVSGPEYLDSPDVYDDMGIPQATQPQLTDLGPLLASAASLEQPPSIVPQQETTNTIPAKVPPGFTEIPEPMKEGALYLMSSAFPSMATSGMIINPQERISYAVSVMSNTKLRSDIRAQIIDETMRTGTAIPEALPEVWYRAQGMDVRNYGI